MRRRTIERLLGCLLFVFILLNAIAFFHAYKFTHFTENAAGSNDPNRMSAGRKIASLFFGVDMPRPENKFSPSVPFESITLQSNKKLHAWMIKVPQPRGTVLLFHGYGGEKSSMLDKASVFQRLGYNTFLVDFMGSGKSEGNQTTIGFKEAEQVMACVALMRERGENNLILFGTSMGAAAVMKAVHDHAPEVAAVILECPFGTMLQTVQSRFAMYGIPSFPMAWLLMFWGGVQNGFNAFAHNPATYARKISYPALLLYGAKDPKVSGEETKTIFAQLAGKKKLVTFPLAAHENYLAKYEAEWTKEISLFLEALSSQ